MAIWPNYTTFRHHFSVTGTIDPVTGYEEWPVDYLNINGFSTMTMPLPITVASFKVTVNAAIAGNPNSGVADAVPGVDEYNWWVSLRTPESANRVVTVSTVAGKSGTIQFDINQSLARALLNDDDFTNATTINTERVLTLLYRNIWIYCQRVSDDAVQAVDLLRTTSADY